MPAPTREELLTWAKGYVAHWNSGDKEAWVANWKKVAPGEVKMLDPVGTPPKFGFDACCGDPYGLFQPSTEFSVDPATMFVCGSEVAWVMTNIFTKDGEAHRMRSIEVYRFNVEGDVEIRTHYDVPEASHPVAGDLFAEYLSEDS